MMKSLALLFLFALGIAGAQQPQTPNAPLAALNAQWVNGVAPGYWPTVGVGNTLKVSAGTSNCNSSIVQYAGGTLSLTTNAVNYVYVDLNAGCAVSFNTTGFTNTNIPIATVNVNSAGTITSVTDVRTQFQGGGGGGVTSFNTRKGDVLLTPTDIHNLNNIYVPIISTAHYASQYLSTDNQGITRSIADCGSSDCWVISDLNDPTNDRIGYYNGNPNYAWSNMPDGTEYEDHRGGGFFQFAKNGSVSSVGADAGAFSHVCILSLIDIGDCGQDLFVNYNAGWNYEAGLGNTSGSYVFQGQQRFFQSAAAGNNTFIGTTGSTTGAGDHNIESHYWNERQFTEQGDSEGFTFRQDNVAEAGNPQGVLAMTTPTTGATAITMTCQNDCQYVGNSMHVLDTTSGVLTDTGATAVQTDIGQPNEVSTVTLSTLTVTVSTVCTLASEANPVIDHGTGTTNNPALTTLTLNCNAPLVVGQLLNLTIPFIENVKILSITSAGTGNQGQVITADLRFAHASGSAACAGGAVGMYLVQDSKTQSFSNSSGSHLFMYPEWVECSTSSNTLIVATEQNGNSASFMDGALGSVHLYHGAEVADSLNTLTGKEDWGYAHISDNNIPFSNGDEIVNASGAYGWWKLNKYDVSIQNPNATFTANELGFTGAGTENMTLFNLGTDSSSHMNLFTMPYGFNQFLGSGYTPTSGLFNFGGLNPNVTNHQFSIMCIYGNICMNADPDNNQFKITSGGLTGINSTWVGTVAIGGCNVQTPCQLSVNNPNAGMVNGRPNYAAIFRQTSTTPIAAIFADSSNGGGSQFPTIDFGVSGTKNFTLGQENKYGSINALSFVLSSGAVGSWKEFMACYDPNASNNPTCAFNALNANNAVVADGFQAGASSAYTMSVDGTTGVVDMAPNSTVDGDVILTSTNYNAYIPVPTGTNTVYVCVTAGTLPVGALTIDSTSCGTSKDSGLKSN